MSYFTYIMIALISILHFYILYIEMFLWTGIKAQKIFNTTEKFAKQTTVMAANQGLYNGFLATGLLLSIMFGICDSGNIILAKTLAYIFLSFVLVAGIYGGITVKKKIFYIQGIPAIIAILSLFFL